ncbi:MAG: indole-3-glycerol phosphate synthase TrpC [Nitrococcus mobilis]|nr:indole-3-glycerol phosphate synthase TrpC [Nitrococcus mobilis]
MGVPSDTPDVLRKILRRKAEIIAERSEQLGLKAFSERVEHAPAPRGFLTALRREVDAGRPGVIAELKKASPSKGVLRAQFDVTGIARSYHRAGATCLSVLTDEDFFQGCDDDLQIARSASTLPTLRKDFIIDAYQVYESRALGADCILLIVAALGDATLLELYILARELGMDVLVEVHSEQELERALALHPRMIGINNRDLHSFETDIETTLRLREKVPSDVLLVTESGILTAEEVEHMRAHGVHCFLIGEACMRMPDPGEKLRALFGTG